MLKNLTLIGNVYIMYLKKLFLENKKERKITLMCEEYLYEKLRGGNMCGNDGNNIDRTQKERNMCNEREYPYPLRETSIVKIIAKMQGLSTREVELRIIEGLKKEEEKEVKKSHAESS